MKNTILIVSFLATLSGVVTARPAYDLSAREPLPYPVVNEFDENVAALARRAPKKNKDAQQQQCQ